MPRKSTGFFGDARELITARSMCNCEAMIADVCVQRATTIHHRLPRGMGGSRKALINKASNGIAVCDRCHDAIESRREWSYDNGFLVRRGCLPEQERIWWRCGFARNRQGKWEKQWCLLTDDGFVHRTYTEDT